MAIVRASGKHAFKIEFVTVTSSPSRCATTRRVASKWNPVEHRVNCEISRNWQAVPLDSYETVLKYIRTTTTATGLRMRAQLIRKQYDKGLKVPDDEMEQLAIQTHTSRSRWNYTLSPRADA